MRAWAPGMPLTLLPGWQAAGAPKAVFKERHSRLVSVADRARQLSVHHHRTVLRLHADTHRVPIRPAGSTGWVNFQRRLILPVDEAADTALWAEDPLTGALYPVAEAGLILTPNDR